MGVDKRGEFAKIDPKDELKDYSGPFKPDLRFSDFTKEQLVKMYLMACEYFHATVEAWAQHVIEKYGVDAMLEAQKDIWANRMYGVVKQIMGEGMGIKGNDIESLLKSLQTDMTWAPGKLFDNTYEMPSKDRGVVTVHKCYVVDNLEALGQTDLLRQLCESFDIDSIAAYAKLFNPDIETTCLAMPPRKSKDDICCKWEFTYKSK